MLKITEIFENGMTLRLRLDGTLSSACFVDQEEMFTRHRNDLHRVILLDLGGVDFMNTESAARLIQLRDPRLRIINCSAYIETLLRMAEG